MRTRHALLGPLWTIAAILLIAGPASGLRIMTYNILNYSSGRTDEFRMILEQTDPDLVFVQEILSQTAVNTFLSDVLEYVNPGEWAAGDFVNGYDTDNGIFYRPARVQYLGHYVIGTALRDIDEWTLRPVGYTHESANMRVYVVHLKASQGSDNVAKRLAEVQAMRTRMETFSSGQNYMVVGDFNIYTSSESAYAYMLSTGGGMAGVVEDPIDTPGSWHNSATYAAIHTQSPRTLQFGGGANGGMDDRFDMMLTSPSLRDATGWEILPWTYTNFGNDGQHFNIALIDPPDNGVVSQEMAQALHDASDHLPVFADFSLPSILVTADALDIGSVIVGGSGATDLSVENGAVDPADDLDYTFAAPAGFNAPAGGFALEPDDGVALHTITMSTSVAGWKSGDLTLTTDAPDAFSHNVALTGTVLNHAVPSTESDAVVTTAPVNFGVHGIGGFDAQAAVVYNQGCGALQALLDVYAAELTGDARFAIIGGFEPATIGVSPETWSVAFDDVGASNGVYSATLVFSTRDQQDLSGASDLGDITFDLTATVSSGASVNDGALTLAGFGRIAPNPFATRATIEFGSTTAGPLKLQIYDLSGRLVRTLVDARSAAGVFEASWNGRDGHDRALPTGIYYARLSTPGIKQTRMIIRCQ
ncbi:FlgD immunoglobulin-like domain containing protein [Candidatus Eisenbacteria bacterium]|uniref:FlgD immunoglobulin-like domain containing protein n=1 Tax=Eiseniibacteriota bacterium TaxID=2212470 RepID=A0ABV6YJ52_UNCEI